MSAFSPLQQACIELLLTDFTQDDKEAADKALTLFDTAAFPDPDFITRLATTIRAIAVGQTTLEGTESLIALERCLQPWLLGTVDSIDALLNLPVATRLHPLQATQLHLIGDLLREPCIEASQYTLGIRPVNLLEHSLITLLTLSSAGKIALSAENALLWQAVVRGEYHAHRKLVNQPLPWLANTVTAREESATVDRCIDAFYCLLTNYIGAYENVYRLLNKVVATAWHDNSSADNAASDFEQAYFAAKHVFELNPWLGAELVAYLREAQYQKAKALYQQATEIATWEQAKHLLQQALLLAQQSHHAQHPDAQGLLRCIQQAMDRIERLKAEQHVVLATVYYQKANNALQQAQKSRTYEMAKPAYEASYASAALAVSAGHPNGESLVDEIQDSEVETLTTDIARALDSWLLNPDEALDYETQRCVNLAKHWIKAASQPQRSSLFDRHHTVMRGFDRVMKAKRAVLENDLEKADQLIRDFERTNRHAAVIRVLINEALFNQTAEPCLKKVRQKKKPSAESADTIASTPKKVAIPKKSDDRGYATSADKRLIHSPPKLSSSPDTPNPGTGKIPPEADKKMADTPIAPKKSTSSLTEAHAVTAPLWKITPAPLIDLRFSTPQKSLPHPQDSDNEQALLNQLHRYFTAVLIILGVCLMISGVILVSLFTAGGVAFFVGLGLLGSGALTTGTGVTGKLLSDCRQKKLREKASSERGIAIVVVAAISRRLPSILPAVFSHPAGLFVRKSQEYVQAPSIMADNPLPMNTPAFPGKGLLL